VTPGRERGLAALLCAGGAGLALLAAGRPWATVRAGEAITPFAQDLTGRDLGTGAGALAWAALAGLAALFATQGRVRAGVGVLLGLFGAGIGYASLVAVRRSTVVSAAGEKSSLLRLGGALQVDTSPWWVVSLAGGVLLVAAGILTVVRGSRWPGMSARYDRARAPVPASVRGREDAPGTAASEPAEQDPAGLWKSLDRGEDPTAAGDEPPGRADRPGERDS
jgi:uncharacterized membrane protein (TIGR02234 family)